jgi:transcriptional regulator with PAS, ATPase and Fis domain
MNFIDYYAELPMAVTVCDRDGIVLYMNQKSIATFAKDGGADLIGKSLLDCHSVQSRKKLLLLIESQKTNTYTIEKNGLHKLIHQTPWFEGGELRGLIEFSFEIPVAMPHFIRG